MQYTAASTHSVCVCSVIATMATRDTDWPIITQRLAKLKTDCKVFGIIVIGETGSGKSTLVNNLIGKDVMESSDKLKSKTDSIFMYKAVIEGVEIVLYDTPGLDDSRGGRDAPYLRSIENIVKSGNIQLVIYCLKMTETRIRDGLVRTFKEFSRVGVKWESSVIALTFADVLPIPSRAKRDADSRTQYFDDKVKEWHDTIKSTLKDRVGLGKEIDKIAVRPTIDQSDDLLPNGKRWYSAIWLDILERLTPAAMARYIEMHKRNFSPGRTQKIRIEFDEEEEMRFVGVVSNGLLAAGLTLGGAGIGAAIGSAILPGPGTAVGGFIGAGVGAIAGAGVVIASTVSDIVSLF